MSITLPATFVDRIADLTPGAIKAYICLSWLKTTKTPRPTQEQIADQMNASKRSVTRWLAELEQGGYIEKRPYGSGRRTEYVLLTELGYGA